MTKRPLQLLGLSLVAACASAPPKPTPGAPAAAQATEAVVHPPLPGERHFGELRQLTFGGENAEAYWSLDGRQLVFQRRAEGEGCDRIYRMSVDEPRPTFHPVSSGQGATTCSFFFPDGEHLLYASTHEGGAACPPRPDMSQGYVWALYDTYDIFKARLDGSALTPLTREKGYDAEATVCAKDGSIVFTSTRDGDIELYRMDKDGGNVRRLTHTPGYDGGAVFNADCTKLVWRASRPQPGKELEDYQRLLAQGLVRPSKLELYVADADGNNPTQVTYLGAASFGPAWFPDGRRILFSSNHGDARGREFDLWAINADGSGLERVTHAPGFDGFPLFSPDGQWLAFSSNRATPPGASDTNVFITRWQEAPPGGERALQEGPVDRVARDVAWLAAPERQGRGVGSAGLEAAGAWLEERFRALGLEPAGDRGTYRQHFEVTTGLAVKPGTRVVLDGRTLPPDAFTPVGYSASAAAKGELVLAGWGVVAPEAGVDDYAGREVKGKLVVVRRFVPEGEKLSGTEAQRRHGDIRRKAWLARERGARALLVVDAPLPGPQASPDWKPPPEAALPTLHPEGFGDAGLPVVVVKRAEAAGVLSALEKGRRVRGEVGVALERTQAPAFNVVGRVRPRVPLLGAAPGAVVVGAHYDHLGHGGMTSLAPERKEPHPGADDNASGTAALLEVARRVVEECPQLQREVYFVAFSAEESGLLGSTAFTRAPPAGLALKDVVAMLNMDMVGRLRANRLTVLGSDSGAEWAPWVGEACEAARVQCQPSGDGYGPSDQTPFYAAGVPVLHFFTGTHADYHKPSDTPERVNAAGAAQVAGIVAALVGRLATSEERVTYRQVPSPAPRGDLRSFNASLGTVPDYAGPPPGQKGMLLAGVRPGSAAELGGLQRGDVLVRLGRHGVGSVEDLMFALNASKPGETVTAVVLRDGREVSLEVTFQESKRPQR